MLQEEGHFPRLLQHIQEHPYFKSLPVGVYESSRINMWTTIRIDVPRSTFYRHEQKYRLYAQSTMGSQEARGDPIFYVPTKSAGVRIPELEKLHGARRLTVRIAYRD